MKRPISIFGWPSLRHTNKAKIEETEIVFVLSLSRAVSSTFIYRTLKASRKILTHVKLLYRGFCLAVNDVDAKSSNLCLSFEIFFFFRSHPHTSFHFFWSGLLYRVVFSHCVYRVFFFLLFSVACCLLLSSLSNNIFGGECHSRVSALLHLISGHLFNTKNCLTHLHAHIAPDSEYRKKIVKSNLHVPSLLQYLIIAHSCPNSNVSI